MISEDQLRELLAQKTETKNIDCKEIFNWSTAGSDDKCALVKDILAFLNTQDGGYIIFGISDSKLELVGLSEADFVSFDTTKVNDFLQKYSDPPASCEVQKLRVDGRNVVVITVPEFKDVPILCKKDANSSKDSSKLILKAGGLYIRTEKATSVLVPSAEEMRDLMNRALLKRGDQLLSTIQNLLKGSPAPQETDIKRYEPEIEAARAYFKEVLPSDFAEYGYWELITMPQPYSRERIPNISDVWKVLTESEVSLRGWNFPYRDKDTQSNFANGRQSYTTFMNHIEAHRAYQSGLFIWRSSFWENFSDFRKKYGYTLGFVNVIYTVTEFFVFLKRYYERISPEASIRFSLELRGIKNRALTATEFDVVMLPSAPTARVPGLVIEQDYAVSELRASAEEMAIRIVQKIFEVFNWNNPDANMIRGWQQRLLSRTF